MEGLSDRPVSGHAAAVPVLPGLPYSQTVFPEAGLHVKDSNLQEFQCQLLGKSLPAVGACGDDALTQYVCPSLVTHQYEYEYLEKDTFKKLYTALLRPHLEYANAVWNPYKKKEFGVLCCLTTPGLRKDIRRQIRQLYSHKVTYYVHYNFILFSHLLSHSRFYFYY